MHTTLRQSSLSFTSKRSTPTTATGKAASSKSFPTTPVVSISHTPEPRAVADIEVVEPADDSESAVDAIEISDSGDDYEPVPKRGKATRRAMKADDIEDTDGPPVKRRRVSARAARVEEAAEPVDESEALAVKGNGKRKAPAKKSLGKSVFRSREGVENSDREGGKSTPGDWKITVKGNQDTPGHVNREELLRHFGEVRERMGNVKPSTCRTPDYMLCSRHLCDLLTMVSNSTRRYTNHGGPYPEGV